MENSPNQNLRDFRMNKINNNKSGKSAHSENSASEKWEIPSDWLIKEMGQICKVNQGLQIPIEERLKVFEPNSKIYITIQFLNNGKDVEYIKEYNQSVCCNEDDILMTRTGNTGIVVSGVFHNNFFKINFDKILVDGDYLKAYLRANKTQHDILVKAGTSTIPDLNHKDFYKIKIPLPPLPEQKAIAACLSTWDKAIHTTEKLIAQKELCKKWLMQQLLTGKKRLRGFKGEWKKLGAGEVFKSVTKKGFADEELLSATQDRGMIPRTMLEGRVTMPTTGTEGFKLVEVGDFVISLRSFQGGLEYSYYRGLVSPAYTVLKPKKPINEEFYKQYFKSYDFIGHLAIAVIGIRDGKQISYDDFCTVKIPYPSIEEQTAIAQVLQAADKEISLLKAKAEKLREQKKGLMQVLLTGKKRLNYDSSDFYDGHDSDAKNIKSQQSNESRKS